jgi:hypothetical protein
MANFVAGVISLTLGVIMVASVLIPQVKGTNTSTWDTGEQHNPERLVGLEWPSGGWSASARSSASCMARSRSLVSSEDRGLNPLFH